MSHYHATSQAMWVSRMKPLWRVCPDREALLQAALEMVRQCEAESGSIFSIVLAGGQTPLELYRRLAGEAFRWDKWRVYFGDERCLPPEHPGRNSFQAAQAWLAHVPIAAEHVFIPPAELGPQEAAARYNRVFAGAGEFDLVLLGLGEDGHTAGLFPGRDIGLTGQAADVLAVLDAPKPPPERISLSAQRLSRSRQVLFLVAGASKRAAVARWQNGEAIPASQIQARQGITVLADAAACPSRP